MCYFHFPYFSAALAALLTFTSQPTRAQLPAEALPQRLDSAASFTIPFDLVGGLLLLRNLSLNSQRGDFVLDTGNEAALVVDQAAFAGQVRPAHTHRTGNGLTGTVAMQQLRVKSFAFGVARYTGFAAHAIPFAHVRRYAGTHVLGLVGYGLLREYEVVIDYAQHRVTCYALGARHLARRPFIRQDSLPFTLVRGSAIAVGYLGQKPVQLLLDTGAPTNQLDAAFCQQLPASLRPTLSGTEPLTGSDGHQQLARHGSLPLLQLGATAWQNLPVLVVPFARPANGRVRAYQGVLGYPFLSQDHLISFDYGRRQLYVLSPVALPTQAGH